MSITDYLILWPEVPALSVLLWLVVAVVFLYFARIPAHQAIKSLTLAINRAMRLASRSVLQAEERLERRNRDVLLAAGCDATERSIEREFHRVDAVVRRDLSGYPAINRKLNDLVTLIDNDYGQCAEVPPAPSDWVKAVETVAKIRATGDSQVAKMLGDIKGTLDAQHKGAMEEYRKSSSRRHEILKKTAPYWRELTQTLNKVGGTIKGITERSSVIDNKLAEFDMIRSGSDKAARMLATSSVTQFVVAGLVLLIAIGGAAINFNLIALPMSEMVGGGSYIGPYKTSSIAAMVIIMVEAAMGLYLMEALRITNLFPVIGSMNDKTRTRMIWITFSILFILASVEASLAYMRDQIAADMQALRQSLAATDTVQPVNSWIPTAGQMVMGFILPFALTFVAIPLESFIHSSRTVVGIGAAWFLRVLAFSLRLLGGVIKGLGNIIVALYDLIVFPPLWVERLIRERAHNSGLKSTEERIR